MATESSHDLAGTEITLPGACPLQTTSFPHRDHFLGEEDLDLKNLSWDELLAVWDAWLEQASATDEADAHLYSHGVFTTDLVVGEFR